MALAALLFSRLGAVGGTLGEGAGGGGGGRLSVEALELPGVALSVADAWAGAGEDEVVVAGWEDVAADGVAASKRATFR